MGQGRSGSVEATTIDGALHLAEGGRGASKVFYQSAQVSGGDVGIVEAMGGEVCHSESLPASSVGMGGKGIQNLV